MPQHSLPTRMSRVAVGPDDEERLLEARIEAGQVGHVGAVLAIGVDDAGGRSPRVHALAQPLEPRRGTVRAGSRALGPACRSRAGRPGRGGRVSARVAIGSVRWRLPRPDGRRPALDDRRIRRPSTVCHGPTSPSGHVHADSARRRRPESEMDPAELAAGVTATDGRPRAGTSGRRPGPRSRRRWHRGSRPAGRAAARASGPSDRVSRRPRDPTLRHTIDVRDS